jgi:hypothetical protein
MMPADAACQLQFLGIDVESIDIVEDAFSVVDDATGCGAVPVPRRQRRDATPEASDQIVKLRQFGGAGQLTSLG